MTTNTLVTVPKRFALILIGLVPLFGCFHSRSGTRVDNEWQDSVPMGCYGGGSRLSSTGVSPFCFLVMLAGTFVFACSGLSIDHRTLSPACFLSTILLIWGITMLFVIVWCRWRVDLALAGCSVCSCSRR